MQASGLVIVLGLVDFGRQPFVAQPLPSACRTFVPLDQVFSVCPEVGHQAGSQLRPPGLFLFNARLIISFLWRSCCSGAYMTLKLHVTCFIYLFT